MERALIIAWLAFAAAGALYILVCVCWVVVHIQIWREDKRFNEEMKRLGLRR